MHAYLFIDLQGLSLFICLPLICLCMYLYYLAFLSCLRLSVCLSVSPYVSLFYRTWTHRNRREIYVRNSALLEMMRKEYVSLSLSFSLSFCLFLSRSFSFLISHFSSFPCWSSCSPESRTRITRCRYSTMTCPSRILREREPERQNRLCINHDRQIGWFEISRSIQEIDT